MSKTLIREGRMPVRLRNNSNTRLRDMLELRRITVRQLAKNAGVPESLLWHLMRDSIYPTARRTCSAPTAAAIERALDVDPGYLFEVEPSPVARNATQSVAFSKSRTRSHRVVRR